MAAAGPPAGAWKTTAETAGILACSRPPQPSRRRACGRSEPVAPPCPFRGRRGGDNGTYSSGTAQDSHLLPCHRHELALRGGARVRRRRSDRFVAQRYEKKSHTACATRRYFPSRPAGRCAEGAQKSARRLVRVACFHYLSLRSARPVRAGHVKRYTPQYANPYDARTTALGGR